jgi:hypothetical protein
MRDNLQYLYDQIQALSGAVSAGTWLGLSGAVNPPFENKADGLVIDGPTGAPFNDYFFRSPELILSNTTSRTVAGMCNTQVGSVDIDVNPNALFQSIMEVSVDGGAFGAVSPGGAIWFDTTAAGAVRKMSAYHTEFFYLHLNPGETHTFRFGHRFRVYAPGSAAAGTLRVGGTGFHICETDWVLVPV